MPLILLYPLNGMCVTAVLTAAGFVGILTAQEKEDER
jgi:hypothetical protein